MKCLAALAMLAVAYSHSFLDLRLSGEVHVVHRGSDSSMQPANSIGSPSACTGKSFSYPNVMFTHVPKTGGTTVRAFVSELCHLRGQKLQVCYAKDCRGEGDHALVDQKNDLSLFDPMSCNQVVYGHMVKPDFARHWLSNSTEGATVRMIREPCQMIVSNYKHQIRQGSADDSTFDEFINSGNLKKIADNYLRFFIENPPYDERELQERLRLSMASNSTLTLLYEKFDENLLQLGHFLGATEAEVRKIRVAHSNSAPNHDRPKISARSFINLQQALKHLDYLYKLVLAKNSIAGPAYPRTVESSSSCVSVRGYESLRGVGRYDF